MKSLFRRHGQNPPSETDTSSLDAQEPGMATPGVAPSGSSSSSLDKATNVLQRQVAYGVMAETLFRYAQKERLFSDNANVWNGVALRLAKGEYVCSPQHDERLLPWISALAILNADAILTITSTVVAGVTLSLPLGSDELALSPEHRVQVVECIEELANCRKAQGAALIRSESRVIVWADKVEELMTVARIMEQKMVKYIWEHATGTAAPLPLMDAEKAGAISLGVQIEQEGTRKAPGGEMLITRKLSHATDEQGSDVEKQTGDPEELYTYQERSTNLQAPLQHGLAVALNIVISCLVVRILVQEALLDGGYLRFAILAALPAQFCVTLFFCDNLMGSVALLIGPIRQMSLNSRYYSGAPPVRMSGALPHITIQMPVFKESLETVLAPTIESINAAIRTYELQGGTASMLVSEDGLLVLPQDERERRLEYYDRHQIAWIARPGHNVDGYIRKGRFKKASNLNFSCTISLAVATHMESERPASGPALESWSFADEQALYDAALQRALADAHPLAQASGNVIIGDLILLIDADTRVPEDCFLDAASEMTQCPDVAVLQHCSGVMYVTKNNYFEAAVGFFTTCVNFAISFLVASGDPAPFMGHNAYLRWSAIQEAAFVDPDDGEHKLWADSTVSEDFELYIRLLMKGYITRWATYSKSGYLEGVSLTCADELNRWQKYAFGVSELIFHPLRKWYKGPITPLFRRYMWAKAVPTHAKFASLAYCFSYYAIASALPLTMGLSLAQALFAPTLDLAFFPPFKVFIAIIFVFSLVGNTAQAVGRFRAQTVSFVTALKQHLLGLPFIYAFFAGLSYHCLTALLAHLVSYNMTWGATAKDLEDSNFFIEVPAILKKYWLQLTICTLCLGGWIVLAIDVLPIEWQAQGGITVFWCPMLLASMHLLFHILLNPQLLRFSF